MDTSSKKGLTMALAVSLIAVGLVTASSLMHGIILSAYAKTLFLPAIVHGSTEDQKISCGTADSKNTHGLYFSAFVRDGSLDGYWDIASYQWSPWEPYKGGFISGGSTNGTTYELDGVEQQDGICLTKGDKNVIISGKCGEGVEINFKTISGTGGDVAKNSKITNGTNQTFTGNVKCVGHTGFK
jgi:hypothetical protein